MKVWYNVLLAIALFLGTPMAKAEWSGMDTTLQSVSMTLTVVDWLQTREIVKHPDKWKETNPMLGEHPSMGAVNTYFAGHLAINWFVARWLDPPARTFWQVGIIFNEVDAVTNNISNGIRIRIAL